MKNSISIPITCENGENKSVETLGLVDSGAGGEFIDQNYAKQLDLNIRKKKNIRKLESPLQALNVDGTENKKGRITGFVDLDLSINGGTQNTRLLVTGLGKQKIILGFPWLNKHNLEINWKTGEFKWRTQTRTFRIKKKLWTSQD